MRRAAGEQPVYWSSRWRRGCNSRSRGLGGRGLLKALTPCSSVANLQPASRNLKSLYWKSEIKKMAFLELLLVKAKQQKCGGSSQVRLPVCVHAL